MANQVLSAQDRKYAESQVFKKQYSIPMLVQYGDIKDLTCGGSGAMSDAMGGKFG
jgi:hypothetical protein